MARMIERIWLPSAGITTARLGSMRVLPMSSSIWCEAPSSPTVTPPWEATSLTLASGSATDWRTTSRARPAMKMAKVEAKGTLPATARPAAVATMLISETPMLKKRRGYLSPNFLVRVEPLRSASSTTMSG